MNRRGFLTTVAAAALMPAAAPAQAVRAWDTAGDDSEKSFLTVSANAEGSPWLAPTWSFSSYPDHPNCRCVLVDGQCANPAADIDTALKRMWDNFRLKPTHAYYEGYVWDLSAPLTSVGAQS